MSQNGYMPNAMIVTGLNQFMQTTPQIPFHQNQFNALESNPQFPFHQNQLGMHALNQMSTPSTWQFRGMSMSPDPL